MTPAQIKLAQALASCSLPIATNKKRFIVNMANIARLSPDMEITEKQDKYLKQLRHYFRRQFSGRCPCAECTPTSLDQVGSPHAMP